MSLTNSNPLSEYRQCTFSLDCLSSMTRMLQTATLVSFLVYRSLSTRYLQLTSTTAKA